MIEVNGSNDLNDPKILSSFRWTTPFMQRFEERQGVFYGTCGPARRSQGMVDRNMASLTVCVAGLAPFLLILA